MDEAEALRRLSDTRIARLATVRPDGRPHLVPIVFALTGRQLVSAIDEKPKRTSSLTRLANIAHQPKVSVLVDEYEEDWSRLWWVRADGIATIGDLEERSIAALAGKYPQYRLQPPPGPAIFINIERIVGWSAV